MTAIVIPIESEGSSFFNSRYAYCVSHSSWGSFWQKITKTLEWIYEI